MSKNYIEMAKSNLKNGALALGLGAALLGNAHPVYGQNTQRNEPIIEECFDSSYVWPDGDKGAFFAYERGVHDETKNLEKMIAKPVFFNLNSEQTYDLQTKNNADGSFPNKGYVIGFLMEKQYEGFSEEGQTIEDFTSKLYSLSEKEQTTLNSLLTDLNETFYKEVFIDNEDGTFTKGRYPLCNPDITNIPGLYEAISKVEKVMQEYGIDKTFTPEQYATMIGNSITELVVMPGNKWGDVVVFPQAATATDAEGMANYSFDVGITLGKSYETIANLRSEIINSITDALASELIANNESAINRNLYVKNEGETEVLRKMTPLESMERIQNKVDEHYKLSTAQSAKRSVINQSELTTPEIMERIESMRE